MAESKKPRKRILKNTETVRERSQKEPKTEKRRRLRSVGSKATKPFKKAAIVGKKEYYLPLPDNKLGRFLNKRRSIIPKYFRESWSEVRQVTWPSNKQTLQLTMAVFIFTALLVAIVSIVDYGLDKIFEELLLG